LTVLLLLLVLPQAQIALLAPPLVLPQVQLVAPE